MAVFVRSKRVTDPLNDKVKACLCGKSEQFSSSGSEHDGDHQEDYDSPSLSNLLIHGGFLQQEDDSCNTDHTCSEASENSCLEDQQCQFSESEATIKSLLVNSPCRNSVLGSHLAIAMEKFAFLRGNKSVYMRNVMCFLRELGHNAGICKTTWDSTGALTAGNYEFIDVVNRSDSAERYIIEIDFSGEFIIARPTNKFEVLLKTLPGVYIGKPEDLKKIVRVMSDAAKKCLKSKGLLLPPWRKNRYMQLKWFGSYKRTTNLVPTSTSTSTVSFQATESGFPAKCRSVVGFDATVENSNVGFIRNVRFAFPSATRTR